MIHNLETTVSAVKWRFKKQSFLRDLTYLPHFRLVWLGKVTVHLIMDNNRHTVDPNTSWNWSKWLPTPTAGSHHYRPYYLSSNSDASTWRNIPIAYTLQSLPRLIISGLSHQRPGFAPRPIHIGFMADSVALRQVNLPAVRITPPVL